MPIRPLCLALATLALLMGWTAPLLADDLAPLVVKGSISGPDVSTSGANDYSVGAQDISNLPQGENTNITDVLGIFQSAYGPRFTILNTISLQF